MELFDFEGRVLELLHLHNTRAKGRFIDQLKLEMRAGASPVVHVKYLSRGIGEHYVQSDWVTYEWTPMGLDHVSGKEP